MRVLVTGGAGFIGSHIARRLRDAGHQVTVVDDLSAGRLENVPDGVEFLERDVSRPDIIDALPRVDAVWHLAAQSSGPRSRDVPYRDLQVNAASTLLLSRWCLSIGTPRFLYASSMAIYGNPARVPVSEDEPCVPVSYYGVSKLTSEHLLRLASREGLNVTALRFFSVYGPGQNLDNLQQGIVSIYLRYLLDGVEVPVTGSLERFRDLTNIDDVSQLCASLVDRPSTPSFAYNVGSGRPTTVVMLLQALKRATGLPDAPIRELPGSPSDQFGLYAEVARAREELGWMATRDLDDGLPEMVAWARATLGI